MMKKSFFGLLAIVLLFSACTNSEFPGYEKNDNGLYYQFFSSNTDSVQPKSGDFITMSMTYGLQDSILVDARTATRPMQLIDPQYKGDIFEAIAMMHKGDSASFILSADSFFLRTSGMRQLPPFIDSGSMLYFNLRLDNIQNEEQLRNEDMKRMAKMQEEEISKMQTYLDDNNISVEPTSSGLYYIIQSKGKGRQAKAGDKVKVHYTGKFLDGTKFDSSHDRNQPIEFELGKGRVIRGWDEGIALMKKGEKATLVIPSSIAYGPSGRQGIPPYSTLVFDVELLDIN